MNDTFALRLPPALNASFKTTSLRPKPPFEGETSTLELIAKTEVNNSQIVCAVGLNNTIAIRSEPAMLTGERYIDTLIRTITFITSQ